jgi:conjugative relaxase-like TrwC/TraI family protein
MTIHKLTAGDGYTYLTRQVAGGDVARQPGQDAAGYYAAAGNPPGNWIGRGAPLLGLAGQQVTEEQMRALFGHGQHPNAERMIIAYLGVRTRPGMTESQLARARQDSIRAATLGRPFPSYEPLEKFDARVRRRLAVITEETGRDPTQAEVKKIHREEARRQRAAVAGFDAVFAPVKSAVLLWALDERPWVREAVRKAHEDAKNAALELLETYAAYTRTGTGGLAQIETNGLIAAAFDHYDSRAGDPNLHTHVAISTKVQGVDGKWRSLDARALYRITVAASECYNTAFETALTARLGVTFTPRPDTTGGREPVREISGVPFGMIGHFSSRRASIETRYAQLVRTYRREHGHDPSRAVCHQLARQANLDTRAAKKPARSLAEMRAAWRASLTSAFGRGAVRQLMAAVPEAALLARPGTGPMGPYRADIDRMAERAVANVATQRSTWTRWNLHAEAERIARAECSFASLAEHREMVRAIVNEASSPRHSISVDAPALLDEPPALRRSDGESVFTEHTAERYTSQAVLDAEQRLLAATRSPTATGFAGPSVAAALDGYEALTGRRLDPGQRHLITAFATCGTLLAAGLGPAGSGKTTATRALAHVLRQGGQRLVPLATSAAAADVLGRELGIHADNLHKFLHEHTRGAHAARLRHSRHLPAAARMYALHPGDVVLVDEAGMAGTFALDQLVEIAARCGAVVRLLGDDRQLSAVESGGALRLIAHDVGTAELTTLYRFADPAEADATLKLRSGDGSALDFYLDRGRVRSGSREAMAQAAYSGWRTDMLNGRTTLMTAASGTDVTALSAQARAERVDAGQVESGGVSLQDGTLAGRGDWIVTRENNRRLAVHGGRDWVKNGDAWRVVKRHHDGSLRAEHLTHCGHVTLPADYVATHVQLLYATTAHRAQGTTVDTAHALITPEMTRESFYVTASRARYATTFYTATHDLLPVDEDDRLDQSRTDPRSYAAREVLENVLARQGAELSATESIRVAQEQAESLSTLVPRYLHAAQLLADTRCQQAARQVLGHDEAQVLVSDQAWGAVVRALHAAEADGWQPAQLLAAVVRARELRSARSIAEVVAWRIEGYTTDRPAPPYLDQPTEADAHRYASLLSALPAFAGTRLEPAEALAAPPALSVADRKGAPSGDGKQAGCTPLAIAKMANAVLGPDTARRARAERAWPALEAALNRAQRYGYDPSALLDAAVCSRELITAKSISEVLAWRIGNHLARQNSTLPRDSGGFGRADPQAWRTLAWMLKAAENNERCAETILDEARTASSPSEVLSVVARSAGRARKATGKGQDLPPWMGRVSEIWGSTGGAESEIAHYLTAAASMINARISSLTEDAVRQRPGWMALLGEDPDDRAQYRKWLHHIGVIAAYRDEYEIVTDDPGQVLGPYPEPGHAGHKAYWHATESVFSARVLAGLQPEADCHPGRAQVAADVYASLRSDERHAVNDCVAQRLGVLWFGESAKANDHAAARSIYADELGAVLIERGHLIDAGLEASPDSWKMSHDPRRPIESRLIEQRRKQPAEALTEPRHRLNSPADRRQVPASRSKPSQIVSAYPTAVLQPQYNCQRDLSSREEQGPQPKP